MKEEDAIRATRWIDGEIKDSEVRDLLEAYPHLREERRAFRAMGDLLRRELEPEREVGSPGVFNRQILRRIEEEKERTFRNQAYRFFSWLTHSEWGLPLAASATLLCLLLFGFQMQEGGRFQSRVVHTFTPNPVHEASTQENGRAGVTVIELQGLAPVPETLQVMGYFPTASKEGPLMASTTYYEGDRPRLLLTMNAMGEPRLQSLR